MDLSDRLEWDIWASYSDTISPSIIFNDIEVDEYISLNTRLGWQVDPNLNLSVTAQNLLDNSHMEYVGEYFSVPTEIERSVLVTLKWTY